MTSNQEEQQPTQVQAPQFLAPLSHQAQHAVSTRTNALNFDDIFGDCFFTPEGDTVFLSDTQGGDASGTGDVNMSVQPSGESVITNNASRPVVVTANAATPAPGGMTNLGNVATASVNVNATGANMNTATTVQSVPQQQFVQVPYAGGITTTGLDSSNTATRATTMGPAMQGITEPKLAPMAAPPQQRHHLQYAMVNNARRKTVGAGSARDRKMSDQQKSERRERNREHAKRSRIRKKFLLESLQSSVALLKEENEKLRGSIRQHLGDDQASELLTKENLAQASSNTLIASNSRDANKVLDDPDFSFIKALQTAQQNFVVTDPSLPDNPIVYATQGFLNLTGYTLDQVLGRNCRFLQGPETDPKAVEKIRRSIEEGTDMSVCLLNYRVDGTTFWNQFFIAALRDAGGNITNYVGVQCKVSDQYAANVCKKQEEEFAKFEEEGNVATVTATPATAAPTPVAVPAPSISVPMGATTVTAGVPATTTTSAVPTVTTTAAVSPAAPLPNITTVTTAVVPPPTMNNSESNVKMESATAPGNQ